MARTSRITAARRERMAQALELREAGLSFRAIGARLGVTHHQARRDVQDALREIVREPAEAVLDLELSRLDSLFTTAFVKAQRDKDMKAVDTAVKVMERRSRFLGLDAPTRVEQSTTHQLDATTAALFVGVIGTILSELGLSPDQEARAAIVVPQQLRAIEEKVAAEAAEAVIEQEYDPEEV